MASNKNVTKVAVDMGNSITKYCSGTVLSKVNSKVSKEASIFGEKATKVEFNNETYYIDKGDFEINLLKHEKQNFLPLLYYSICEATDDNIINLGVGCPVLQYTKANIQKIKSLIGNSAEVKITKNNITIKRSLVFDSVNVFPESIGAYVSNKNEMQGRRNVIVDIGSRTTDIAMIDDNGNILNSTSSYVGVIDIFSTLVKEIMSRYQDLKLEIEDGETILKNGYFTYDGKKISCDFALIETAKHLQKIKQELLLNFNLKSADVIFVTGGGSMLLGAVLKESLSNVIVDQNLYSNVKGFYSLMG